MKAYSRCIIAMILVVLVLALAPDAIRAEVTRVEISSWQDVLGGATLRPVSGCGSQGKRQSRLATEGICDVRELFGPCGELGGHRQAWVYHSTHDLGPWPGGCDHRER